MGQIITGGAADLDGRLKKDDEIIEIDGHNVEYCTHAEVVEKIQKAGLVGHVKLVVRRIKEDLPRSTSLPFAYNYVPPVEQELYEDSQRFAAPSHPGEIPGTYTVDLAKLDSEDFGCTIMTLSHRYIGKIHPDSPAARCGRLHPGDCVIAINGCPLYNMSHQQVINFIKSSGNTISFTVDPTKKLRNYQSGTATPVSNQLRSGAATPQLYAQIPHKRFSSNYLDNGHSNYVGFLNNFFIMQRRFLFFVAAFSTFLFKLCLAIICSKSSSISPAPIGLDFECVETLCSRG